jgi:uncharacterized damage-inducible protein DinB
MKLLTSVLLFAAVASAQDTPANPLITVSKMVYDISKKNILGSVDKIPDDMWSYQPVPEVRTVAQLFAHVADAQYEFCGVIVEGKSVSKDIEKTLKTKAEIVPALKEAFAYCDGAYAKMTDADAAEMVTFFGMKATKLGILDFNSAHNMEHYGNLVTYMRIKGIVPPSSEPRKPAPAVTSGKK